jgi:DNA-binding YbaB/EbfC family protein
MAKRNKMPGNMNNMMKQVQKMQRDMEAKQKEIESSTFQATAGGGAITVEVSGKKEVLNIELDEDIVDPDDIEMLQDLIVAAVNEALRQADEAMAKGMGQFTGGLNIPGLM